MFSTKKMRRVLFAGAAFIGIFAFAFYLAHIASENGTLQAWVMRYGYLGVFFISIISGFNIVVPVPAISFLPLFLESGLNFWIAVATMVLGLTIADTIAYFLGLSGRFFVSSLNHSKTVVRLDALRRKWKNGPLVALFFFAAFAPFPNEVLVVPLGFLGYHLRSILPILLLGNSVFHVLAALGVVGLFNAL